MTEGSGVWEGIRHREIAANGIRIRLAEAGAGPLVLLCHGFPESWYSWRHQLRALAEAGYHAVAPDMRGYGGTEAPPDVDSYTIFHLVGDAVATLDALGAEQGVIVGHDWGSIVAWNAAMMRPERFRGVVGMSVPFLPRPPIPPIALMKAAAGDRFFYILYFQEPGVAERELEGDSRTHRKFFYSASGSLAPGERLATDLPRTAGFLDGMVDPETLPDWLTEEDLQYYVDEFSRTGFRGGLNWYRNFDRNWELTGAWAGAGITIPSLYVGGLSDLVVTGGQGNTPGPMVTMMDQFMGDLRGKVFIEGAGHWSQQEAPEATNRALLEFLHGLGRP